MAGDSEDVANQVPVTEMTNLSKDIFAYGMAQLPVASSRVNPYDPYLKWSREVAQFEADREALVRYVRALRTFQKIQVHLLEVAENNAVWNEVIEAYEALSQELKDAISKESHDEAEI